MLIGAEVDRPYDRPSLSKDCLQGKSARDKIFLHPPGWYAEHDVELRLYTRVTAIDRRTLEVVVDGGEWIGYGKLLLATGSSPRRLDVPGADLDGVPYPRTVGDSEALKAVFASAGRVAIIGAGWIGLETAAAARNAGCEVTVIERAELPLQHVLGHEVARIFAELHRDHGVDLRLDAGVSAITGAGKATGVRLADGMVLEAEAVLVWVGITPNTELAEAAGLAVDNGVIVDAHLATTDPDVFAAGDVASCSYPHPNTHLRLEHWSAALNHGPIATSNMLGETEVYDRVPYFFCDQYDLGMEYSGGGHDEVVFRGDVSDGDRLQHLRAVLPCQVRVTAATHPLFGELLAASDFHRLDGVLHLVMVLPDGSPGTIRAETTDVLGARPEVTAGMVVLDVEGLLLLRQLVLQLQPDHRSRPSRAGLKAAGRNA